MEEIPNLQHLQITDQEADLEEISPQDPGDPTPTKADVKTLDSVHGTLIHTILLPQGCNLYEEEREVKQEEWCFRNSWCHYNPLCNLRVLKHGQGLHILLQEIPSSFK